MTCRVVEIEAVVGLLHHFPQLQPLHPGRVQQRKVGGNEGEWRWGGEYDCSLDYVDYDSDVTIPPNLTDLLANLPQDISADSLQKMFRDSVADRRALLQGFDLLINKAY